MSAELVGSAHKIVHISPRVVLDDAIPIDVQFLDGPRRWEAAVGISISRFFRRLFPFPFAGLPVVAGHTALDHFVAPAVSLNNKRDAVAAAKADGPEHHHNADLQQQLTHEEPSQAVGVAPVAPLCKISWCVPGVRLKALPKLGRRR